MFRSFRPKDNVVKVRSHPCSAPLGPKTTSSRSDLTHVPLLQAQRPRRQGQISPMFRSFMPKDSVVKVRSRPCSAPSCPKTTSSRSDLTHVPLLHAPRQRRQGQISPMFRSFMPKDNVVKVRSHPCSAPSCPKTTSSRSDFTHVPLLHAQRQRRQGQISSMVHSFIKFFFFSVVFMYTFCQAAEPVGHLNDAFQTVYVMGIAIHY